MDSDKITVDEPLISTDVDSLIRTIADKKKVPLHELRRICKIDKKNMDKWIAVLEEEGYINVEYGLGATYVIWKGLQESPPEESYSAEELPKPKTPDGSDYEKESVVEEESSEEEKAEEAEDKEEFAREIPLEEPEKHEVEEITPEPAPEEMLSQYVAKRKGKKKPAADDIKSNILISLKEESVPELPEEAEPEKQDEEIAEAPEEPEESHEEVVLEKPEVLRPMEREAGTARAMSTDVRELMGAYLDEINKEKVKIEELKKERENVYREKFTTLEGKMQADMVAFTEKILEKQEKLSQIKESVLELPDKVGEVEQLQEQMEELKMEGRAALERTRKKAEEYIGNMKESKEKIKGRIEKLNSEIDEQADKVEALEQTSESMDERSQRIRKALEVAQAKVDEVNSAMSSLMDDLEKIDQARAGIAGRKEEVKEGVAAHGEELSSLMEELGGISRLEQWVQEYVRDYQEKIEGIEDYVSRSEGELMDLKESAESLYMKKYLGELEDMTAAYGSELDDALRKEKKIEQKIVESRSRITELARESQEMIKKLQEDVSESKDFDQMLTRVRGKTSKVKKVVEEKEKERGKLAEDVTKTRKSKRSIKVKARSEERPKPKRKKKKPYPSRKKKK